MRKVNQKRGTKPRAKKAVAVKRARDKAGATTRIEAPLLAIRELDPVRICGDRTTVIALFRVDETQPRHIARGTKKSAAEGRQVHLVFNDRHGWYCEHGRSCHAVRAVMKHAGIR